MGNGRKHAKTDDLRAFGGEIMSISEIFSGSVWCRLERIF
jgi:hypothetical protein